ncbi:MAG: hypothetical protein M3R57_08995 [Chloroflexota bacterium]|nr:hypothetical protein [Chloroflexota bacterium]
MRWLLPPVAAGLWIVLALLAGLIGVGAAGVGIRANTFALWAAASVAMAVAIVATRGAPRSRIASAILAVTSAVGSLVLMSSSIPFVAAMALILSVAIAVASSQPWATRKEPVDG